MATTRAFSVHVHHSLFISIWICTNPRCVTFSMHLTSRYFPKLFTVILFKLVIFSRLPILLHCEPSDRLILYSHRPILFKNDFRFQIINFCHNFLSSLSHLFSLLHPVKYKYNNNNNLFYTIRDFRRTQLITHFMYVKYCMATEEFDTNK
jgi:hypothetical protein